MTAYLVESEGRAAAETSAAEIEQLLEARTFFWLDLHGPEDADMVLLRDVFGFHPLAVEDSEHFGQRPKIDQYDDFVFIVFYGAVEDEDDLVEVHCFYSERFLVTVRRDHCPAFERVRERHVQRGAFDPLDSVEHLYQVLDGLVDSFFPILDRIDESIDTLESAIFAGPTDAQLQEMFGIKRRLARMRRTVAPQRDLLAALAGGLDHIPGVTPEAERYFRNIYDHMIRITDTIDSYRDLMSGAMDVYLSTVSNRLNDVMKKLTIIATILIPLTFLTGFFGQNFEWMVRHVAGLPEFIAFGIVLDVAVVAGLLLFFRRRRWI